MSSKRRMRLDRRHVERAVAERDARGLAQAATRSVRTRAASAARARQRHRVDAARRAMPTNSVPSAPQVIARAVGTRATTSIANPGGSLMRSSGSARLRGRGTRGRRATRRARTATRSDAATHRRRAVRLVDAHASSSSRSATAAAARLDTPPGRSRIRSPRPRRCYPRLLAVDRKSAHERPRHAAHVRRGPPPSARAEDLVALDTDPHARRLRHDEPRLEPRADRLGARLPRPASASRRR